MKNFVFIVRKRSDLFFRVSSGFSQVIFRLIVCFKELVGRDFWTPINTSYCNLLFPILGPVLRESEFTLR